MIPANEWWMVLQNYNETVFPSQILFYLLAISAISVSFWQTEKVANRLIKGFFVLAFGWIGIVFFLLLGQKLPAHNVQAFLFLSLSALFAIDLFTETNQFKIASSGWQRTATFVGFGIVLVYPLVGLLLGRPAVRLIIPGTFPCPTTALALVFMATTLPTKRRWLYLTTLCLLLIWAIPFPIMIQIPKFGVYEDGIMLAAGIYSLVMLVINWNTTKDKKVSNS